MQLVPAGHTTGGRTQCEEVGKLLGEGGVSADEAGEQEAAGEGAAWRGACRQRERAVQTRGREGKML